MISLESEFGCFLRQFCNRALFFLLGTKTDNVARVLIRLPPNVNLPIHIKIDDFYSEIMKIDCRVNSNKSIYIIRHNMISQVSIIMPE